MYSACLRIRDHGYVNIQYVGTNSEVPIQSSWLVEWYSESLVELTGEEIVEGGLRVGGWVGSGSVT